MNRLSEAKLVFDKLLANYGFRLAVEHYDHEHFGSAYIEYARRGMRFRLVWDARDESLTADVAPTTPEGHAAKWSDLELLCDGPVASVDVTRRADRIPRLAAVTERHLENLRR